MKKFRCSVLFKFSFIIFLIEYLSYMFWKKPPKIMESIPFMGNMSIFIYVVMVQSSDYSHV